MLVDSASEYWDRGRLSALRHTSLDGREDVEDAPNVRVFMLAGTRHGAGSFPPADSGGQFKENTNDYRWAQRGLLAALDAWVRQGTPPPESRHPRLSDLTLVAHEDWKFPPIPGVQWPTNVPGGYRADVPGPYSALPFLVSRVDADGNDLGGIRLPEQAVPLATLTGTREDARPEAVDHRAVRNTRRLREEDSGIRSASCAGALHPEGRCADDRARGRAALGLLDDSDHANQPGSEVATSAQL